MGHTPPGHLIGACNNSITFWNPITDLEGCMPELGILMPTCLFVADYKIFACITQSHGSPIFPRPFAETASPRGSYSWNNFNQTQSQSDRPAPTVIVDLSTIIPLLPDRSLRLFPLLDQTIGGFVPVTPKAWPGQVGRVGWSPDDRVMCVLNRSWKWWSTTLKHCGMAMEAEFLRSNLINHQALNRRSNWLCYFLGGSMDLPQFQFRGIQVCTTDSCTVQSTVTGHFNNELTDRRQLSQIQSVNNSVHHAAPIVPMYSNIPRPGLTLCLLIENNFPPS